MNYCATVMMHGLVAVLLLSATSAYPQGDLCGASAQVVAKIREEGYLEKYKGKLKGKAVLATPPASIDLNALAQATPRRTADDLKRLEEMVTPGPQHPHAPPAPRNPGLLKPEEKIDFWNRP